LKLIGVVQPPKTKGEPGVSLTHDVRELTRLRAAPPSDWSRVSLGADLTTWD
jgi:hypothetical protein